MDPDAQHIFLKPKSQQISGRSQSKLDSHVSSKTLPSKRSNKFFDGDLLDISAAAEAAFPAEALAKQAEVRNKFQADVVALLSDEQKEKLPARMQRVAKAASKKAGAKGKRKKKKEQA